jgi:hypothetical protein
MRTLFDDPRVWIPNAIIGVTSTLVSYHIALDGSRCKLGRLLPLGLGNVEVSYASKSSEMRDIGRLHLPGQMIRQLGMRRNSLVAS